MPTSTDSAWIQSPGWNQFYLASITSGVKVKDVRLTGNVQVNHSAGLVETTVAAWDFWVGYGGMNQSLYRLTGTGQVKCKACLHVGESGGDGKFVQDGPNTKVTLNGLRLAVGDYSGNGVYEQKSGEITGTSCTVGHNGGVGNFIQSGGTTTFDTVSVGSSGGSGFFKSSGSASLKVNTGLTLCQSGSMLLSGGQVIVGTPNSTYGVPSSANLYACGGTVTVKSSGTLTTHNNNNVGVLLGSSGGISVNSGGSMPLGNAGLLLDLSNYVSGGSYNVTAGQVFNVATGPSGNFDHVDVRGHSGLIVAITNPPIAGMDDWALAVTYQGGNVTATVALPGDINLDRAVDSADMAILGANYNATGKTWSEGDVDGDGDVDASDMTILGIYWGDSW